MSNRELPVALSTRHDTLWSVAQVARAEHMIDIVTNTGERP